MNGWFILNGKAKGTIPAEVNLRACTMCAPRLGGPGQYGLLGTLLTI